MPKDPIRITTATATLRSVLRYFRPSEWAIWLLGLRKARECPTERGLIMIQIDGLSCNELHRAMECGRMKFLRSLVKKEGYRIDDFYSGLPSSTPAVQGELFYGKRTVVPAFGFRDHRSGRLVRMFANDIAAEVESELEKEQTGLLLGGSSYCNIFSGGATDTHFCATSFGWSEFFNTVNPAKLFLVMLLNFWMFFRVAGLMVIEMLLATLDFVRGVFSGKQFWQELIMIPARVTVVVLLRELVTTGACFDAARGVPIIHLNLLGYDEQAHRRGPASRFAHWTLSGIDYSIRRIWNAAHRGAGREYDVWVYSDHGQETTIPYQIEFGKSIQQVVAELAFSLIADDEVSDEPRIKKLTKKDALPTRADWLGIGWIVSMIFGEQDYDMQTRSNIVQTVTSGPLGFVYLSTENGRAKSMELAQFLVAEANVPMTVVATGQDSATVFTDKGKFRLPQQAEEVFGNHPFLKDIGVDLVELSKHPDSGDIALVGWARDRATSSFVLQNGAHAGPGDKETHGFAMLPSDIGQRFKNRWLRPDDLRCLALEFLGRTTPKIKTATHKATDHLDLMTYNAHACVGMDGLLSPARIARIIDQSGASIVCLQELDVSRERSGKVDQALLIAEHLAMTHRFHPAWHLEEEQFGNAILTTLPVSTIKATSLHHHKADRSRRSALWVEIETPGGVALQVINTHLSIYPAEQRIQTAELMREWIEPASKRGPVVLCGDFNATPRSKTCRAINKYLKNVESFDANPTARTLFSPFPFSRVDHIFVSPGVVSHRTNVIKSRLAKIASDHLPVMSQLSFDSSVSKRFESSRELDSVMQSHDA